jgi:hypothetical protein
MLMTPNVRLSWGSLLLMTALNYLFCLTMSFTVRHRNLPRPKACRWM